MNHHFTLAFSPCPNDTFIFDALVNHKIDTKGYEFDVKLEDVETLNQWAIEGKMDISKISYGLLPALLDKYELLNSGGALGKGVGPLLVSGSPIANPEAEIRNLTIALPGEHTTAHMLFNLFFPGHEKKVFMIFSEIEEAVKSGKVEAGVIIHESRFTYQKKGLVKLLDLGEYWERSTAMPIPLGGIVMKKHHAKEHLHQIELLIRESLNHALKNYPSLTEYVRSNSQEMEEEVMRKHIDLYVNNYSLDLGIDGRAAIERLTGLTRISKV